MIVYVYHKYNNQIERFDADDLKNNTFISHTPYGREYCILLDGDKWNEDLEELLEEVDVDNKDWYRREWL